MIDFLCDAARKIVILIGVITFGHLLYYLYKFYLAMWGKAQNIKEKFKTEWVMITGASSGVGKHLTLMCAKQKLNIIGIGRSEEKLKAVAELVKKEGVEFRYHAVDLSDVTAPRTIFEANKDVKIGCLFVCHGFNNMGRIIEMTKKQIRDDLNAMTTSVVLLTSFFGKQATNGGTVTYISSLNGENHVAYAALYGASKRFLNHFVLHLQLEGFLNNLTFQAICPNFIADTAFYDNMPQKIKDCAKDGVTPERVANAVLATAGKNITCDIGWDTIICHFFMWILPDFLQDWFFSAAGLNFMKEIEKQKKKTD